MPRDESIRNILIIGSGPIVIGQAAEFDYSGTQACKAYKEEGCRVVVLNPNPATIQTELEFADAVYLEPITIENIERIIVENKIDSIASSFGGQTALNIIHDLEESGIIEKYKLKVLGTGPKGIKIAEDRDEFRKFLLSIMEPAPLGIKCTSMDDVMLAIEKIKNFPMIVRASFALGGTGSGIAKNKDDLLRLAEDALNTSPIHEVLIEESLLNFQEFELELIRDKKGNKIVVCSMENIDPMGVHTGESIVVTPSLTLSDDDYQKLRDSAFKIIDALEIIGSCNIQFAVDQKTGKYYVIEVNPRTSRSSALASKATGFPIARISAKISLGYNLDEIINPVTGSTYASFEPAIDYITVKIPRWPFDRFRDVDRKIGMSMKSTGEAMGIGRNFEEALMKALYSLDQGYYYLKELNLSNNEIEYLIKNANDQRIFAIGEALRRNWDIGYISKLSGWDTFFVKKIKNIVFYQKELKIKKDWETVKNAKKIGISDKYIAECFGIDEKRFRIERIKHGIVPVFKGIDTCAGEFKAISPYFYSTYDGEENESIPLKNSIIILGSGPIRIGQGIEFDYLSVEGVLELRKKGYNGIIINNNPETVSTDFDISSKLYFEPLTFEYVANIIDLEKPEGIIVQFGGQTAINLVEPIWDFYGDIILGTKPEKIDLLEDRDKFSKFIDSINEKRAESYTAKNADECFYYAEKINYPVLVRPSYIIGGSGVSVLYSKDELKDYIKEKNFSSILIEKFIENAIEMDIDVISDGENVHIMGILEHLEEAGVHSGDATMVFPPININDETLKIIEEKVLKITKQIGIVGFVNYQLMLKNSDILFIEANPRGSRTVPFLSKARGINYTKIATDIMLGEKLKIIKEEGNKRYYVKFPVFSFRKLHGSDPVLGPEMKSTGEIMGIGKNIDEAIKKGFDTVYNLKKKSVLIMVNDESKDKIVEIGKILKELDFEIYATKGTGEFLNNYGINAKIVSKIYENDEILNLIKNNKIGMVINIPSKSYKSIKDGYDIRRLAIDYNIPVITNIRLANYIVRSLKIDSYDLYPITSL